MGIANKTITILEIHKLLFRESLLDKFTTQQSYTNLCTILCQSNALCRGKYLKPTITTLALYESATGRIALCLNRT